MPYEVSVLDKYKPLIIDSEEQTDRINYLLISGRIGGKTYAINQKCYHNIAKYRDMDIQVLRANSSSMKESTFTELKKYFYEKMPFAIFSKTVFRETPPLLITMPWGNQIRFGGVGLGSKSGSNQSRGKISERRLSLIVFEETQEIFSGLTGSADLLNQAKATYIRNLDEKVGKIIFAGNTERNLNGKFNVWCRERENDKTFHIIKTDWRDIRSHLTRPTIQMIETEAELNPNNYKYMYLGIPIGGANLVYSGFDENIHCISEKDAQTIFSKDNLGNVYSLYIGVDASSTQDVTAFMPIFHFKNNKYILKTNEILHHDPSQYGQLTNAKLSQVYVKPWLISILDRYNLRSVSVVFIVDGHAADLEANLRYEFANFPNVSTVLFGNKDLKDTTAKVNNAFTAKALFITEEDFKELTTQRTIHYSVIVNELQIVCWLETDDFKFNDSIPNDMTDALRYAIAWRANTPYQIRDLTRKGGV